MKINFKPKKEIDKRTYVFHVVKDTMLMKMQRYITSVYYWSILATIRDLGIYPTAIQRTMDAHVSKSWLKIKQNRKIVAELSAKLERNRMNKTNFAASKIQTSWKRVMSSPDYLVCRKRLEAEFESLASY